MPKAELLSHATSPSSAIRLRRAVRKVLEPLADAPRAAAMRAYMRGRFERLGIGTPERRAAVAPLIHAFMPASAVELRAAAEVLWAVTQREYQYVAADLLNRYQAVLSFGDLRWLLALAQQKSWWDTVDGFPKVVGRIVRSAGAKGARTMDRAIEHENFWVRRIAMLHQLGAREQCDTERLFRYAELLAAEKEFFLRKAVGWALRDYAWHDCGAVESFLKTTTAPFSGLTLREAGKNLEKLPTRRRAARS